jgi:hypothetical protein
VKTFERMTAAWEAHKASQPGGVFDTAARFRFTTKWVCAEFDRLREEMKPVHLSPHRWDCETCGPDVAVDEDGCCSMCGRHCNQYVDGKLVVKAEYDEDGDPAPVGADGGDYQLDRISVPRRVLRELLVGVKRWADQEDGIPEEISAQWARLNALLKVSDTPEPQPTPAPEFRAGLQEQKEDYRGFPSKAQIRAHAGYWEWKSPDGRGVGEWALGYRGDRFVWGKYTNNMTAGSVNDFPAAQYPKWRPVNEDGEPVPWPEDEAGKGAA